MAKLAGILPEIPIIATMIRACVLFVCLIITLVSMEAKAVKVDNRTTALLTQADTMHLAKRPGWLALLHFRREALLPIRESQADGAAFFLAADGKTDPHAELQADLRAMLHPSSKDHAQCRFPARWHWLKQQLHIVGADVPCPEFERWMKQMQSTSVSLVFPSMYLNNPGSSFGHTFLRFNNPHSTLLSQTFNYAADVNHGDNGISYVFKGLFGGYHGVFRIRPYYETVKVYSNLENRDIWEYTLSLNNDEIAQLKRHIWEVSRINFDYYFFRENCAYRLLALIDAVRPQARLASYDSFPLYAIPVDTVRALKKAGLIKSETYRPSLASQIKYAMSKHDARFERTVVSLADGDITVQQAMASLQDNASRADMLSTAYQILQFRKQQDSTLAKQILNVRSTIHYHTDRHVPAPVAPELGHASARFSLGVGTVAKQHYYEIALKPAFHDLLDAPQGYIKGAEINVLDTRVRWLPDRHTLQLQRLRFFNVVSLSPWQAWYHPLSWQFDVKLNRQFISPMVSDLVFGTRVGGGISSAALGSTWYAMAIADAEGSDKYKKGYSVLSGVQLGMSTDFSGGQWLASIERSNAFSGADISRTRYRAVLQFNLGTESALRVDYRRTIYDRFNIRDFEASLHWYF